LQTFILLTDVVKGMHGQQLWNTGIGFPSADTMKNGIYNKIDNIYAKNM